jgi:hypothetical protein
LYYAHFESMEIALKYIDSFFSNGFKQLGAKDNKEYVIINSFRHPTGYSRLPCVRLVFMVLCCLPVCEMPKRVRHDICFFKSDFPDFELKKSFGLPDFRTSQLSNYL